jgi:ssDNA-binding Zn-finger/Zn-ribbon topoisomerase 1
VLPQRAEALVDAFLAALRDEIAAARSHKGETVTSLSEGALLRRDGSDALYAFMLDHPVGAADDTPVQVEIGGLRYTGTVLQADSTQIVIALSGAEDLPPAIPHAGLITRLDFIPQKLQERLELARSGDEPVDVELALQVFTPSPPPLDPSSLPDPGPRPGLNASQARAVAAAQVLPVSFVWGPPGTGKTATIAHIAAEFARRGLRVLVVSHSNIAVDEAALDIARLFRGTELYETRRILRLGHHRHEELDRHTPLLVAHYIQSLMRLHGRSREALSDIAATQHRLLTSAAILCTTLTQTFFGRFPDTAFDVCIVDEASMAPLPALFWALTRARRHAVIAGDFLQLPPVSLARTPPAAEWLGRSIYQVLGLTDIARAREDPRVLLLDTQYRMHPVIASIPNRLFYAGLLKTGAETAQRSGAWTGVPITLIDTEKGGAWCARLPHGSRINLHSAQTAALMAARLAGSPPRAGQVAIITPYNPQARLIGALLRDLGIGHAVRVATVHRFQGGEVPIVIFDTVEAPPERPAPLIDDTRDPTAKLLLNVALTRPQRSLVVLAHRRHLRSTLPPTSGASRLLLLLEETGSLIESWMVTSGLRAGEAELRRDIEEAKREILVAAPSLSPTTGALLETARQRGVEVTWIRPGPPPGVTPEPGTHVLKIPRPLVILDGRIVWDGLPTEHADRDPQGPSAPRRFVSERGALALRIALTARSAPTEAAAEDARVEIPTRQPCPDCGALLIAVVQRDRILLECERGAKCGHRQRVRKSDRIPTDRPCPACGRSTVLMSGRFGPFLGCSGYPICQHRITVAAGPAHASRAPRRAAETPENGAVSRARTRPRAASSPQDPTGTLPARRTSASPRPSS